jgi:hypothetical protein
VHVVTFILFVIIVTSSPVVLTAGYGVDTDDDHAELDADYVADYVEE